MKRRKTIVLCSLFLIVLGYISTSYGEVTWSVSIRNHSDNSLAYTITWSGVQAGEDTWKVANQYLDIALTATGGEDWGIQIYTDNKGTGADPTYTGGATSGYNLVGVSNPTSSIHMCWKVVNTIGDWNGLAPVMRADWSGFSDYCWKWIKDKTQTSNPFTDDEFYVRVWDNDGIYWHESPTQPWNPGFAASPNYVILAARFHDSAAQEYKTNRLVLELYVL